MTLEDFIAAHLSRRIRATRTFDGDRGWIHLANLLFRKLERNGMFAVFKEKEVGVEVDADYWITRPSDMRILKRIYYPYTIKSEEPKDQIAIAHENLNGKIKLVKPFEKDEDPDVFALSLVDTEKCTISDPSAAEDEYKNMLMVLTSGTYSGRTIIIGSNDAGTGTGPGELTVCYYRHTQPDISNSTACYLTDDYLMLQYIAKYTDMTEYDEEIPLDSNYEDILEHWFNWKSLPAGDKNRREYKELFEEVWEDYENEIFTPTEDQVRQRGRRLIGMEDCYDDSKYGYTGE